jgi:hypothetical protein
MALQLNLSGKKLYVFLRRKVKITHRKYREKTLSIKTLHPCAYFLFNHDRLIYLIGNLYPESCSFFQR